MVYLFFGCRMVDDNDSRVPPQLDVKYLHIKSLRPQHTFDTQIVGANDYRGGEWLFAPTGRRNQPARIRVIRVIRGQYRHA